MRRTGVNAGAASCTRALITKINVLIILRFQWIAYKLASLAGSFLCLRSVNYTGGQRVGTGMWKAYLRI